MVSVAIEVVFGLGDVKSPGCKSVVSFSFRGSTVCLKRGYCVSDSYDVVLDSHYCNFYVKSIKLVSRLLA